LPLLLSGTSDADNDPERLPSVIDDEHLLDYYEVLQISPNADPDTIHRIYRLLAQRFHPDNQETGEPARFRQITEAYQVLIDPEQRTAFDLRHQSVRQERMRVVTHAAKANTDFEIEQLVRLTVLEALYTQRRVNPNSPGIFDLDLEGLTGQSREHLEFTFWYLISKNMVKRGDSSRLLITAEGVDYLEQHYETNLQRKRLKEASGTT
jgi:curved DNA-binding protein CbpA